MKTLFRSLSTGFALLSLSGVAHAGTSYVGPAYKAGDEFVTCVATNVSRVPVMVTIDVLDEDGVVVATRGVSLSASGTDFAMSAAPTAVLCRFTTSVSAKSIKATLLVRENGGSYQTRAAISGK